MSQWHSVFCHTTAVTPIEETLSKHLLANGYSAYNPFGRLPGRAYPRTVKLFISPTRSQWTRLILDSEALWGDENYLEIAQQSATLAPSLYVALQEGQHTFQAYSNTPSDDPARVFEQALAENMSVDAFRQLWNTAPQDIASIPTDTSPSIRDLLPTEYQGFGQGVNNQQAEKLFEKMSGNFRGRFGGAENEAEVEKLLKNNQPQWESAGGNHLRAIFQALSIADWQLPDFATLRDAYTLHARKQRNPQAMMYPGDAEAMASVPNALEYIPLFFGKTEA